MKKRFSIAVTFLNAILFTCILVIGFILGVAMFAHRFADICKESSTITVMRHDYLCAPLVIEEITSA